jgi:hypothetical protein
MEELKKVVLKIIWKMSSFGRVGRRIDEILSQPASGGHSPNKPLKQP